MRSLLPAHGPDPEAPGGLHAWYATPTRAWVRANMICSVDGAASVAGRSGGLGSSADRQVLSTLRDHADVILVGATTVRTERYHSPDPSPGRRARRLADGRAEVPRLAVIGSPEGWTGQEGWIAAATAPPLLLTARARARDLDGVEVLTCGEERVSLDLALDALAARGLVSVLCEGGPGILSQLVATGRLQELCVSFAPMLVGPGPHRIMSGEEWPAPMTATLTAMLEDAGMLLCRYSLAGDPAAEATRSALTTSGT